MCEFKTMDSSSDNEGDEDASEQKDIFSNLLSDDDEDYEIQAAAALAASFVRSWMRNHKWRHTRLV